jgi:hypothetical protein
MQFLSETQFRGRSGLNDGKNPAVCRRYNQIVSARSLALGIAKKRD